MPTYDYKCISCNYTFEFFQSMKDEPLTSCPKCGGQLKRIIGPGASPIFKGNGFYETDYKNNNSNSNSKKSNNSSTKNESSVKEAVA